MLVTLQEIFTHVEIKHDTLNQEDLEVIYATLRAVKSPSSDFSALAETHRNLHRLLAGAGQPCAEFDKTQHYINAIKDDPSGREAVNIFIRNHPLVANRTFVDLVATVLLHAPTIISSTSSLGYSNALATTTVATALAAAPTDESALKQQTAKLQKDLAATHNRTKGPPSCAWICSGEDWRSSLLLGTRLSIQPPRFHLQGNAQRQEIYRSAESCRGPYEPRRREHGYQGLTVWSQRRDKKEDQ